MNIVWDVMLGYKVLFEETKLHVNEIASSFGIPCNTIFGLKCIVRFSLLKKVLLYHNYVQFSDKLVVFFI